MTDKARLEERKSEQDNANLLIFKAETFASMDQFPKRQFKEAHQNFKDKKAFFDEAGPQGTISADWRCVTDNVSPLVKSGGVVVDLGGSSGRYAEFLALSRKDISQIYAIEPDKEKFDLARAEIKRAGLEGKITLINKPIPEALKEIQAKNIKVDAVTSLYRTHLQTDAQNTADMAAVGSLVKTTGASFLSIDLHRPKLHSTAELMAKVYPADSATHEFRDGYVKGLESALRGSEMTALLEGNLGKQNWNHSVMNVIGQLQLHVMTGQNALKNGKGPDPKYPPMEQEYIAVANDMNMGFRMSNVIDGASTAANALTKLGQTFAMAVTSVEKILPITTADAETNARPASTVHREQKL